MSPAAAPLPERGHALPEPVGRLQARVPGHDELGDAEARVLLDSVRDLSVAADQRRGRAAADQPDAGPQVRVDLQAAPVATLMQFAHAALSFGLAAREARLRLG